MNRQMSVGNEDVTLKTQSHFSSYATLQDSYLQTCGRIPDHWNQKRLKYCTTLKNNKVEANVVGLPYLGLENVESGTGRVVSTGEASNVDGIANCFSRDNVLFGKLRPYLAKVMHAAFDGICTSEFLVLQPRLVTPRFLFYFMLNSQFVDVVDSSTYGAKMPRASWNFIGNLPMLVPPLPEQQAIANFLDRETAKIDALIAKKRRLIELLQEKRDALTRHASSLPDTKHLRLGVVADQIEREIQRVDDEQYTPIGLYNWGRGIFHKDPTYGADLGDSTFFSIEQGDFIVSGQFAWEGAIALARETEDGCVASHRYPVFRAKPELAKSAYLLAFFKTPRGQLLLGLHSRGAAGRNRPLNPRTLMKEEIAVPSLGVQEQIAVIVRQETTLQQKVNRAIETLQELRSALISGTVTGKINVRNHQQGN